MGSLILAKNLCGALVVGKLHLVHGHGTYQARPMRRHCKIARNYRLECQKYIFSATSRLEGKGHRGHGGIPAGWSFHAAGSRQCIPHTAVCVPVLSTTASLKVPVFWDRRAPLRLALRTKYQCTRPVGVLILQTQRDTGLDTNPRG
jgi:hypothetical protein